MRIKINATIEQFYHLSRILWDKANVDIEIIERRDGEYDLLVNYANSEEMKEEQ